MASIGSIASVFCASHMTIDDQTEVNLEACQIVRAGHDEQLRSLPDE